jgi:hypothetical protein
MVSVSIPARRRNATMRDRHDARSRRIDASGVVVTYLSVEPNNQRSHEAVTRNEIARGLAALRHSRFAGEYDPVEHYMGSVFFVPGVTVVGINDAAAVGIRSEGDLFGGVVPYRFVATKSITHPLVDEHACTPEGWSSAFSEKTHDAVLKGYSAFSRDDAQRAGERLLQHGAVRIKRSLGIGGSGQFEIANDNELSGVLSLIDDEEIASYGVVIEENLTDVTTCSVGQVRVAGLVASYYGTQRSTRNNSGHHVYGGSDLTVVRGEFDALLALPLDDHARLAIAQARAYDEAASCFDGLFASRRNYDVAQGLDAHAIWRSGVLEQSWRMGGACGAEIGALQAFAADGDLCCVNAQTVEIYGPCQPPPGSVVYFQGVDERVGMLTKYATVSPYNTGTAAGVATA